LPGSYITEVFDAERLDADPNPARDVALRLAAFVQPSSLSFPGSAHGRAETKFQRARSENRWEEPSPQWAVCPEGEETKFARAEVENGWAGVGEERWIRTARRIGGTSA
jgi:hypothetical protein